MKLDNVTGGIIAKIAVTLIVLILVYFMIVRPVLRRVGVIETKEDKKRNEEAKVFSGSLNSPFSPNYWKEKPGAILLSRAETEELAARIESAIGYLWDDENTVYGVLRQLKAKTQLSWLCDIYFQKYKADMYQVMNRSLSDDEMDVINNVAAQLA